jgi:hypothetical protein
LLFNFSFLIVFASSIHISRIKTAIITALAVLSPRCGDFDLRRRSRGLKKEIFMTFAKNVIRAVVCAAIVLVLGSCFEPWDDNTGTVIINMEASRGAQRQGDNENDIQYKITFSGKSGKKELKAKGGKIIKTTLAAGIWKIDIEASLNGKLYTGSDVVEVKAGQTVHKDDIVLKYTCVHQWDEVERTPATCSAKGKIEYICLLDASHTKTVEIDIDPNAHNFINPEITPATCEEPGEEKGTCTICGNEATIIISALGHAYIWTQTTDPTCTEPGEETGTCTNDSSHTTPRSIAALGHDYANWTQTTDPTCTEAGVETGTCTRGDGATTSRAGAAALGHDFADNWEVTQYITITHDGEETDACTHNSAHKRTRPVTDIPTFTAVADLGTYLTGLPTTTAADAYKVKLNNVADLTSPTNIRTTLGGGTANGKYVYLDLSGSNMTSIADNTFYGSPPFGTATLVGITIPNSVISIGQYAFSNCANLTSVNIPDGVTSIGQQAFFQCTSLASITIPDGVTSISYRTFYECTSLTSVSIGSGVTSIGDNAFRYCSGLTNITIPNNVTSIGSQVFDSCTKLTSVTFERANTTIYIGTSGDYQFPGGTSLIAAYTAGGIGTYTRASGGTVWTKED